MDKCLSKIPEEDAEPIHKRVFQVLQQAKPPPSNLPSLLCSALRNLHRKEDILILTADKGRTTVIMERSDYDSKTFSLLGDSETYVELGQDPTPSMERKLNALLLQLKKKVP